METPEELIAKGGAILAFDTNAMWGSKKFKRLCNLAAQLREPPHSLAILFYVPALVHAEMLFDIRQTMGSKFQAAQILQGLADKGLKIQPFEERHAESAAEWLGESYASTEEWHTAKRQRFIDGLGLKEPALKIDATGKHCAATVDFYVAAHVAQEGWILVTDDMDPEFERVSRKMKLERLERCLDALLTRGA